MLIQKKEVKMRRRRRRKKKSKMWLMWKVLIALNTLVFSVGLYVAFTKQPAVQRWAQIRCIEGAWNQVLRNCNIR